MSSGRFKVGQLVQKRQSVNFLNALTIERFDGVFLVLKIVDTAPATYTTFGNTWFKLLDSAGNIQMFNDGEIKYFEVISG